MFENLRAEASGGPARKSFYIVRWTILVRILAHEMGHLFLSFLAVTVAGDRQVTTPNIGEMTLTGSIAGESHPESGWYLEWRLFGGTYIGLPEGPSQRHIEVVQVCGFRSSDATY
jgi:hypothetical protein